MAKDGRNTSRESGRDDTDSNVSRKLDLISFARANFITHTHAYLCAPRNDINRKSRAVGVQRNRKTIRRNGRNQMICRGLGLLRPRFDRFAQPPSPWLQHTFVRPSRTVRRPIDKRAHIIPNTILSTCVFGPVRFVFPDPMYTYECVYMLYVYTNTRTSE